MGKLLSPDDVEAGMRVTVAYNKPLEQLHPPYRIMMDEYKDNKTVVEDRSFMGDVLTILNVDYPYVLVRKEKKFPHDQEYVVPVDMRRSNLMSLSAAYIHALCPHLDISNELKRESELKKEETPTQNS